MLKVKVKKLFPQAKLPIYATPGSACFDIYAHSVENNTEKGEYLSHGAPVKCGVGLAFEIPEGYGMKVYSRSGHGFNHMARLCNGTGIIDNDYRNELFIKLVCDDIKGGRLLISPGERIAQGEIFKIEQFEFEETDALSETIRGEGGLGHTGVK